MRVPSLLAVLTAAYLLMLPAVTPAQAQFRPLAGPGSTVGKGFATPGIGLRLDRKFRDRLRGAKFDKHIDHRFRHSILPVYDASYRRNNDTGNDGGPDDGRRDPPSSSEGAADRQPQVGPPVMPKWIRVDVLVPADRAVPDAGRYPPSEAGVTCREPMAEITVNGEPVEAYREHCAR